MYPPFWHIYEIMKRFTEFLCKMLNVSIKILHSLCFFLIKLKLNMISLCYKIID